MKLEELPRREELKKRVAREKYCGNAARLNPIEQFVWDNQPIGAIRQRHFRNGLVAVINHVHICNND